MPSSRLAARRALTIAGVSIAALAGGAPALASDASLRKAVVQQEQKVEVVAETFAEDADDAVSAVGRERASAALKKLQSAVRIQRTAVVKQKATTPRLKRARTQYIAAIDAYTTGLKTFGQGLVAFDPDSPSKSAALIEKAETQLTSATTRSARARTLILRRV